MEVVIEIPAGSFVKTAEREGRLVREFISPLPSLFNYGYAVGIQGADGMPQDVVVLGPQLRRGQHVLVERVAVVRFSDRGLRDDKWVARVDTRPPSLWERTVLILFFTVYAAFKRLRYGGAGCRFEGLET